jgi:hypothetical protein
MAWFNRRNKDEVLPEEVQDYYKAEQRDRMGVAWLLAAGAFILTVAIILGLFLAGRWAYQGIFSSGSSDETTSEVELTDDEQLPGASTTDETDGSADETADEDDQPETEETSDDTNSEEVNSGSSGTVEQLPQTGPSNNL